MTQPMTESQYAAEVLDELANRFVLAGRPLNPAYTLQDTARFGDDAWDLTPAMFQQQMKALVLNFTPLPLAYRLTIKHLCFAMLCGDLPAAERRAGIASIRRHLVELKRFVTWLDGRTPGRSPRLGELTAADLSAYAHHLSAVVRSPASREAAEVGVRLLWRYRTVLPEGRLSLDPLEADGWGGSTLRRTRSENSTPRIPEAVMGPLLTWSLRFIDDFAPDILAAHDHQRRRLAEADHAPLTRPQISARLEAVLEEYLHAGRPLPGRDGKVNYAFLLYEAGATRLPAVRTPAYVRAIDAVAAITGISTVTGMNIPITACLDGEPWVAGIGASQRDPNGAAALTLRLQSACYIVIAYLSGMRDSEIKHLKRGCVRIHRDSTGAAYRWTITSRAFKNETDPAGTEATWVIGAPAARAVKVLEALQPPDVTALFRSTLWTRGQGALNIARTNQLLNAFIVWINAYCAERDRTDSVAQIEGVDWTLSTRQFRRTLAWHIARRPGGAIAGAIQFRHLSVQMFEGYAGTSDSGFRAEVEAEQALTRGEHLLALISHHEHPAFTGPAAPEATRRLNEFADQARFQGQVVTDPRRVTRLMQRHDPAIYPGTYITCMFDPAKALCQQRRDGTGTPRPSPSTCQPLDCRNTALTRQNVRALREEARRIDAELAQVPALPPLLAARLSERRTKITTFLARHDRQDES
jgi:integrase